MNIYKIEPEITKYKTFEFVMEDDDVIDRIAMGEYDFKGKAKGESWVPPAVKATDYDNDTSLPIADITKFSTHALAYSAKAVDVLSEVLKASGELLPFEYKGNTYFVHNNTNYVDLIDKEASSYDLLPSGRFMLGSKVVLDSTKLDSSHCLFKQKKKATLFLGQELEAANDYRALILKAGLTGISFSDLAC